MKLLATIFFMGISMSLFAQKQGSVQALVEHFRLQMINPDKVVLEKILHEDLSYGHSSGVLETKREVLDILLSGRSDYTKVDFVEPTYTLQKNSAVVRCTFVASLLDAAKKPVNLNLKVVMVLVKSKNGWQILLRQGFRPPAN